MTVETTCETDLLVFVDNSQHIWFDIHRKIGSKIYSGPVAKSELSVAEFAKQSVVRAATRVMLLGMPSNANLICELHYNKQMSPAECGYVLRVGTPSVCGRQTPPTADYVLHQMATLAKYPSSCGGWHDVSASDYVAYGLIRELELSGDRYVGRIPAILRAHPAWPAVSFIPSMDERTTAIMLAQIIDPRWYIDPSKPNRIGRLRSYMGMWEPNMRELASGNELPGRHFKRAQAVWRSWATGPNESRRTQSDPESFLLRKLATSATQHMGMLKASALYLHFLRDVWLDAVTPGSTLFVSKYFFKHQSEATAYDRHVAKLRDGS